MRCGMNGRALLATSLHVWALYQLVAGLAGLAAVSWEPSPNPTWASSLNRATVRLTVFVVASVFLLWRGRQLAAVLLPSVQRKTNDALAAALAWAGFVMLVTGVAWYAGLVLYPDPMAAWDDDTALCHAGDLRLALSACAIGGLAALAPRLRLWLGAETRRS